MSEVLIRLQKYLSDRGVASRRSAAQMIEEGRVRVNGDLVCEPGARVPENAADVTVDGKPIATRHPRLRTIILYKPRGYVCSSSSAQGRTVHELLTGIDEKLVTVGRLDKNSEGLLLLSNDGALVNRLTHPRYGHEKVYKVTVSGAVTDEALQLLRSRLVIDEYRILPVKVRVLSNDTASARTVLRFEMREGRNRQIRKMCEQAGLKVHRLIRTRFAGYELKDLRAGQWREASNQPTKTVRLQSS